VTTLRDGARRLGAVLPHGRTLPDELWRTRHRWLVRLLWAHAIGLPIVALLYGRGWPAALIDGAIVAAFGVAAALRPGGNRTQSVVVALGLLTCSAVLVVITRGLIEAHFHFFVMVAALSLYEDWVPFLTAVAYVFLEHGLMASAMHHRAVFDHPGSPWKWAIVHAGFIAALSVACMAKWRAAEHNRLAFRSLVNALEEGVLMVDRDGALITANPSAGRILGMEPKELLSPNGSRGWVFLGDDGAQLPEAERPIHATAATGESRLAVPMALRRPDGVTRWLSVTTRAVEPTDSGAPHSVVVSFTDITEEREAVAALERSNSDLQQFAYIASHDLSEPLRMVSSYLQLLRRRYHGRLDSDADEFIDFAVEGATRMRSLIEGLLAYSRAGRGEESSAVALNAVAGDVLRSLAAALVEAGADVEVAELPPVLGSRLQLEQLLQNLLANALKFRGGAPAFVRLTAEPAGAGMVQLAVEDAGIGIEPQHRDRVFKMFQRLHDRETYEGTGIGLAICRKIVERHGGRIWVEERPGGGTVFRFTLPVAPEGDRSDGAGAMAVVSV
jgi:PAS domain S-box-containing protein